MGIALNVTSRKLFRQKLKKDFDYDEKSGLQIIAVPDDNRRLDNSFHLRDKGFPSFWVVDISDDWKVIHHESASNTGFTQGTCAIPARKSEHNAYIKRMTEQLSVVLDSALAGDSAEI